MTTVPQPPPALPPTSRAHAPRWVFVILLASYAFFWQARDWNSASRLMLTYALADRGTVSLDGLDRQTGDKAHLHGRYYCDKLPGFSLLAVPPYLAARGLLGLPPHPLHRPAMAHWPADYWTTLGTSGLFTALCGALLSSLAGRLGCGPRRSALVGLAYGLATPAYAYATLAHGHQASSLALLASFALLWDRDPGGGPIRMALAGFLAATAAVVELQVGPVSAILGLYLLVQVAGGSRASSVAWFALGAAVPTLALLGYNLLAFGSPWDMGYFHHATPRFRGVHSAQNPTGLVRPRWQLAAPLLWGGYRGLAFYAPVTMLTVPGWLALAVRRYGGMLVVSLASALAMLLVNLSYPEWTGGWSTGPRLLVPALPFLMLPVAGLLAVSKRFAPTVALVLFLAGWALMTLFVGVGTGVPERVPDPLLQVIWPHWRGDPIPRGWPGDRFTRNLVALAFPVRAAGLPSGWQWVQFLPLVGFQVVAVAAMLSAWRRRSDDVQERRKRGLAPRV